MHSLTVACHSDTVQMALRIRADFAPRVVAWQRLHGRHGLPWQGAVDPATGRYQRASAYHVWLSEVMLQQTQVATVRAYFLRFVAAFPTVQQLAAAPLDAVLALWTGLGYYARARNLHRAAQVVVNDFGGEFPSDPELLVQLPGVGRSTAAAIASLSFGQRAAILDGNVKRVLARLLAFEADVSQAKHLNALWQAACELLPQEDAAEQLSTVSMPAYTQGLMDLGATLCTKATPCCSECPVADLCAGSAAPQRFPAAKPKRARQHKHWALHFWVQGSGAARAVYLQRRPDDAGIWAGLYAPVVEELQLSSNESPAESRFIAALKKPVGPLLAQLTHKLTHCDLHLSAHLHDSDTSCQLPDYMGLLEAKSAINPSPQGVWVKKNEASRYGLPRPVQNLLAQIWQD